MKKLKKGIKPLAVLVLSAGGFAYDWVRFARYAGTRRKPSAGRRRYLVTKAYRKLEKSLSFANRTSGRGRAAAIELHDLLTAAEAEGRPVHFQEDVGRAVLGKFAQVEDLSAIATDSAGGTTGPGGVCEINVSDLKRGVLDRPEDFFTSRHSLRDFDQRPVDDSALRRAVQLATHSPSVCNRQGWHVYKTQDRGTIDKALSFQNGNAGFGHRVPALMIISADLNAFDAAGERFQPWIDGGMFSMSLVWALHAIGLGSCCLNWSKGPRDDRRIRMALNVEAHHSIIMMLALGHPQSTTMVCDSARTPSDLLVRNWKFDEILS